MKNKTTSNFKLYACWIIILVIGIVFTVFLPSPPGSGQTELIKNDSLAILSDQVDSLRYQIINLQNKEAEFTTKLIRQRLYYENKIAHIDFLPADSQLCIFSNYTDRLKGRYFGRDSTLEN